MSAEGRHCYKCGTYLEGSTCYYCQGVEDSKRDTEKIMNKPEPLKFEYEELRNKDNEVVAYRLFPEKRYYDHEEYPKDSCHRVLAEFLNRPSIAESELLVREISFWNFKDAVYQYNAKYCKQPEIDTSILDGFEKWCEENHYARYCRSSMQELFSEFKATLKPQYFTRKEQNNEQS